MNYLDYLKNKLNISESSNVIDSAVRYLGKDYPKSTINLKGFEIVDSWIGEMKSQWNIEIKILNLTKTNMLGKIEPKKNGFIINLNKNLFITQRRLTIAHEISHVLSYNISSIWPKYEVKHSRMEEYYCDCIARAILLPKSLINFGKFEISNIDKDQIDLIKQLWPEFKVSPWQILLKLFDDDESNNLVGIFWEYFKNESCLKIISHFHPKNIFIPKDDRIFLNNLLNKKKTNFAPEKAFNSNEIFQGEDLIEIGSLYKKKLHTTTFPIKTKSGSYVIQIIKI